MAADQEESTSKWRVFVASSSEARDVAMAVHRDLDLESDIVAEAWPHAFRPSQTTIDSLEHATRTHDYAVIVVTGDDLTISRGIKKPSPRDNVVFEMGLFIGAFGKARVFIICEKESQPKLPSDLFGVTVIPFRRPEKSGDDWFRAVSGPCTEVKGAIRHAPVQLAGRGPSHLNYGLVEYANSFKAREGQFRSVLDTACSSLIITGTALRNLLENSWAEIERKVRSEAVSVTFLVLDPDMRRNRTLRARSEVVYRPSVLDEAQRAIEKITSLGESLPKRRGHHRVRLRVTKFFMPVSAIVADPEKEDGRMVVEVIGASAPGQEYFSRPRYILRSIPYEDAMFKGYWQIVSYLVSDKRSKQIGQW